MQAERPPPRRDIREDAVQPIVLGEKRRELVHDDHEPGQIDPRVGDVPRTAKRELVLASAQLGPQARDRPLGGPAIQVGDHARDVREVRERVERHPALEIGEEEGDLSCRIGGAQRRYPRRQQLGLAAARDARDDGVRSIADEVHEHVAVARAPQGHG